MWQQWQEASGNNFPATLLGGMVEPHNLVFINIFLLKWVRTLNRYVLPIVSGMFIHGDIVGVNSGMFIHGAGGSSQVFLVYNVLTVGWLCDCYRQPWMRS